MLPPHFGINDTIPIYARESAGHSALSVERLAEDDSFTGRRSSPFRPFSIQELADHYVGKRKLTLRTIPLHLRGKDIIEPREVRNLSRPVSECRAYCRP
jgi:hypothetical protein